MATCKVVQTIDRTECIGNSLVKINSNFGALDLASCELTTYIDSLQSLVLSLSSSLDSAISQIGSIGSVPVGAVSYFVGSTAPTGWLIADGSAILIATYSNLSNMMYVGNVLNPTAAFGYKSTSNTNPAATRSTAGTYIKLPDLRGYFLRGLGTNADGSASVAYGSIQADGIIDHTHSGTTGDQNANHSHGYDRNATWPDFGVPRTSGIPAANPGNHTVGRDLVGKTSGTESDVHGHNFTSNSMSPAGTTETRPKNVPLLPCIKY